MKKAAKIAAAMIGGLIGAFFACSAIYDFLGLTYKSMKDHGWTPMNKAQRRSTPIGIKLKCKIEAAEDVMKDVVEGWAWKHRRS